jgi:antitoxin PrlF
LDNRRPNGVRTIAYEAEFDFVVEAEFSLTDRHQTTVPETIRRALKRARRHKIHDTVKPSGEIVMARADAVKEDGALGPLLHLLTRDINAGPERFQPLSVDFLERISVLTDGIEYDIHAALPDNE